MRDETGDPKQPELEPTQLLAAGLLAAGMAITEVCETLEVSRSTLYRWRQEGSFKDEVKAQVDETWGTARILMKSSTLRCIRFLDELVADEKADMNQRRMAAGAILALSGLKQSLAEEGTNEPGKIHVIWDDIEPPTEDGEDPPRQDITIVHEYAPYPQEDAPTP